MIIVLTVLECSGVSGYQVMTGGMMVWVADTADRLSSC